MEALEGIQPPPTEPKQPAPPDKTPITIRAILLYDGTMNNKTNIKARESQNEFYQKTRRKKYLVFGERVGKGDDSYENGPTNIVSLDGKLLKQEAKGYDLTIPLYVEGAGTIDHGSDKTMGYAIGVGVAGVKAKCEKGINELIDRILEKKINNQEILQNTHYIKKMDIDLFGFSRGAATARYAVHQLLLAENSMLNRLKLRGFDVADTQVEVNFVGIFDTVSSHGVSFSNDVEPLKLNAITKAKKVMHLAAADEHRKNFSLTNIKSCKANGEEYFLPGVHSDVGGSYHDMENEGKKDDKGKDLFLNSGSPSEVKTDRDNLIADGWYKPEELIYEEEHMEHGIHARLKAQRYGIRNAYCNIPLKIMAKAARDATVPLNPELEIEADSAIDKSNCTNLKKLDQEIDKYKFKSISDYPWQDELLMAVRNRHFHMSAKDSIGLYPRFKDNPPSKFRTGRVRWRQEYDG